MIDVYSGTHGPGDGTPIDWPGVAREGISVVAIKATQGSTYVNPWLERDAHGARAAGVETILYHYAMPATGNVEEELDHFLARGVYSYAGPNLIGAVLDLEETGGLSWNDLSAWGRAFLDRLAAATAAKSIGASSILYSNRYWLGNLVGAPWSHQLWIASPGARPRRECFAWQFGTGPLGGVPEDVDLDRYFGRH